MTAPLKFDHVTKARVRAAAGRSSDARPRVQKALQKKIEDLKPGTSELNRHAWNIVSDQSSLPEKIDAALEGATEAARLHVEKIIHFFGTLASARYRACDYAGALESLSRGHELYTNTKETMPPSFLALVAMSEFRLGRVDDALASLARLRALVYDPMTWKGREEFEINQSKVLFAEAEAMIDPKANLNELNQDRSEAE